MSNILQSADMNDAEKQKLYNTNLERYLDLKRQKESQIPTARIAPNAKNKEEFLSQKRHIYLTRSLQNIYWKRCAKKLLQF